MYQIYQPHFVDEFRREKPVMAEASSVTVATTSFSTHLLYRTSSDWPCLQVMLKSRHEPDLLWGHEWSALLRG